MNYEMTIDGMRLIVEFNSAGEPHITRHQMVDETAYFMANDSRILAEIKKQDEEWAIDNGHWQREVWKCA